MMIAASGGRMGRDWARILPANIAEDVAARYQLAPAEVVRTCRLTTVLMCIVYCWIGKLRNRVLYCWI